VKRSLLGCTLLCILSAASLSFAQTAFTSLRGNIKDPSGALIPGVKVTITDSVSGHSSVTTTTAAGEYIFSQIPPAKYTITVTASGFGAQSKIAELLVDQPATVDFALTLESSMVTVDVSATAQTLNTSDATMGNSMDNTLIQAIPSETRNVPDLLSLQPGVLYLPQNTNDSRTGAVNGGRSDQGNITIDGIDNNDQINGTAFTGVLRQTQDAIQEFRVVTGGSNADAGRSSGAQISMITKSGTNKIHGAAYGYIRNGFDANDWFNKNAQVGNGEANVPGKLIRNIFGADLGGPIKKDKLFLFMNYEGWRLAENAQVSQTTATDSFKNGILSYQDVNGNKQQLQPSDVAAIDSGCTVICNSADYPYGPGPNPNVLKYLQSMPTANVPSGGDAIAGVPYNTGTYTFSSHHPQNLDTYIARLDYQPSSNHSIFVRGQLQGDTTTGTEQFPGTGPSTITVANNRGLIAGHTWVIKQNLVNDLRYGFIRAGGGVTGVGKGDYVDFRSISTPTSESRSSISNTPVNTIVETLSWIKGSHSLSFGFNWRMVGHNSLTDANSYDGASTNPSWFSGGPPEPTDGEGNSLVNSGFTNSYKWAYINLVGAVPSRTNNYNYHLDSATSATALADGVPVERHFKANEYEGYVQDSWRIKPNLTLTYGLRYSILQTPWETKGQEVLPTVDTHQWFVNRGIAAAAGQVNQPDLSFAPGGKFYNKPGFFPMNKNNFAPRLAIAYAPSAHTSIRAGFGVYFDHYGEAMVNTLSSQASYGMSTSVTNPASRFVVNSSCAAYDKTACPHPAAPRYMDRNTLPNIDLGEAPPTTASFPYTYPEYSLAIKAGVDNHIKSPYSETFNFSVQHEFRGGFTAEAAYVGRLGRHLFQNLDLAEPTNYVDPLGGGDYFSNADKLSAFADSVGDAGANYIANVPTIQYFEDVFPWMKNYYGNGESATTAIYNAEWGWARYTYGETNAIYDLDLGYDGGPGDWVPHFYQNQFSSFYALSSIGSSYYNAGQFTLRHPFSHGLAFDVSYTLAHSIDLGSDTERNSFSPGTGNGGTSLSAIYNSWNPALNRGTSEFDTRHLITGDYVYLLPFGRGKALVGNANGLVDAIIGGWQLAGSLHWSSGLPFSLYDPGWNTNWELSSYSVQTGPVKMHRHIDSSTLMQYFDNADNISLSGSYVGKPMRLSYPGEAGMRNHFRGDGYFGLDSGLSKTWKTGEFGNLKFTWELYNVTNTVRFDPQSIGAALTYTGLGEAGSLISKPRVMQFSLRYDF
jgi:Carboxypeptidase regulatory-like domain/TonB dependent receptor